jgi:hypothetical protein
LLLVLNDHFFHRLTGRIIQIKSSNTTLDVNQTWGYYTSFDSNLDSTHKDQNSGAYIFRPSTPEQRIVVLHPKEATFVKTSVGTEVHATFDVPWLRTTTRILANSPHVEVEYTVGPIDIADGRGKEIVTRLSTSLQTDATFYTDSNGREFLKRRRNYRPTWNLNVFEPVAGNYYPVNTAIFMEDVITKKALAVVVDRTSGGSSLEDGSIEVMVQRRIISDDGRGVDEALNETSRGINSEPPFGNATRLGDGIVMTGTHRILVGDQGGASLARSAMDEVFVDPLVFVASAPTGQHVPLRVANVSAIQGELPPNVMLITRARLYLQEYDPDAGMVFLIRLGHQYGVGEDETLSKPVQVALESILVGYKIVSVQEKTLSGNQDYSSWLKRRFDWTGEGGNYISTALEGTIVTLRPMDILTFEVGVQPMGL